MSEEGGGRGAKGECTVRYIHIQKPIYGNPKAAFLFP